MITELTLPTLLGYGVVTILFVVAFGHVLELRARRKALLVRIASNPSNLGGARNQSYLFHPTDVVLRRAIAEPALAKQEGIIKVWTDEAVFDAVGRLAIRMDRLKTLGPLLGFTGSVTGLILGLWLFGAEMDQARLFESAALALVTTLGGALVALVEVWAIKSWLTELDFRLRSHATRALIAFRASLTWSGSPDGDEHDRVAQDTGEDDNVQTPGSAPFLSPVSAGEAAAMENQGVEVAV